MITTTYGYDAPGNLTTATLPATNGYIETRTYDLYYYDASPRSIFDLPTIDVLVAPR